MGKGEIVRYKQFLLFPQCSQKTCTADTYKPGLVLERVKHNIGQSYKEKALTNRNHKKCISLTLSETTNFRLFQIERVCRLQFQI